MSLFSKILRNFKHHDERGLERLVEKHSKEFIENGAIAVAHDGDGIVVFTNIDIPQMSSYSDSKLKIIKLDEPFRAYNRTGVVRPMQGGISIGHRDIGAGTLSTVVVDKQSKKYVLLSNNHVFANVNKAKIDDPIYQPGIADAQERGMAPIAVGRLSKFVHLKDDITVDAALAEPIDQNLAATGIYQIYPEVRGEAEPVVGLPVQKSGRSSDTTYGTVTAIGATVDVYYGTKTIRLRDCFICKMSGAPGDSGSLITTQGSVKKVVGLLFAGGGGYIIGCKWSNIKSLLDIDLAEDIRPVVLDISKWNGRVVSPQKMKDNKVLAVYLKITQGDYYKDERFAENWDILKNAGIKVAPYIFVDPSKGANAHFTHFINVFGTRQPDLPVMLDCEYTAGQSREVITSIIQKLAELIEKWQAEQFPHLKPPLIYTRASWWNDFVLAWSGWKRYGLWVARYGVDHPWIGKSDRFKVRDWDEWLLWQYSADENNDGARYGLESRAIDKNIASEKFVREYLSGQVQPPPSQPPVEYKYVGVVRVSVLNIRQAPSVSAARVGVLRNGEYVRIVYVIKDSQGNLWAKLGENQYACARYYGQNYIEINGYKEEEPSHEQPIHKGKVVVIALNVRDKPSTSGKVLEVLRYGALVDIYEEITRSTSESWVRIGADRYCARRYDGVNYIAYL